VGVAVVTILLLIFFRVRSKYQYPDSAAAAKGVATVTGTSTISAGVVTITTTANHGYVANDVLIFGNPPISYIVTGVPTLNKFTILASSVTPFTAGTTFKPAYKTLTDALEDCNIANQNRTTPDDAAFSACISTRTSEYVASMCPWLTATPTTATAPSAAVTAKSNFDTDINAIKTAYTGLQNGASADLTNIINAARRADITGATRKYLAAACPNYYVSASGTATPASYSTWATYAVGATITGAPVTYFDANRVSFASGSTSTKAAVLTRLKEWAKYAATDNNGTTPLVSTCTTLYTAGTTPNLNWKLAQQYGPGTVTTLATLPWNTAESTCAAPPGSIA